MDGNRVWGGGRKGVECACGEGSVWVRSGFGVGSVGVGGRNVAGGGTGRLGMG